MERRAYEQGICGSVNPGVALCRDPLSKLMDQTGLANPGFSHN
jgi:hypothetical protein